MSKVTVTIPMDIAPDVPNKNGRVWPRELLQSAIQERIQSGGIPISRDLMTIGRASSVDFTGGQVNLDCEFDSPSEHLLASELRGSPSFSMEFRCTHSTPMDPANGREVTSIQSSSIYLVPGWDKPKARVKLELNFKLGFPTINGHKYDGEALKLEFDRKIAKGGLFVTNAPGSAGAALPINGIIGMVRSYVIGTDGSAEFDVELFNSAIIPFAPKKVTTAGNGVLGADLSVRDFELGWLFLVREEDGT